MTATLTARQQEVFDFIKQYLENKGYPPTLSEIASQLSIQPNAVRSHLLLMQNKNVLRYVPNISRGIELLNQRPAGIPIYGTAPAGSPFLSQENVLENFEVRNYISASNDVFGVYVKGDSMKDALLITGDLVFVDPKKSPRNGEIVVALVEGEPTIKRYYEEDNAVVLKPENKKYNPIIIRQSDESFCVLGVVMGVIRSLDKKKLDMLIDEHRAYGKPS